MSVPPGVRGVELAQSWAELESASCPWIAWAETCWLAVPRQRLNQTGHGVEKVLLPADLHEKRPQGNSAVSMIQTGNLEGEEIFQGWVLPALHGTAAIGNQIWFYPDQFSSRKWWEHQSFLN